MLKYANHHCPLDHHNIFHDPYHYGNPVCDGAFSSYVLSMEIAIDSLAAVPDPNDYEVQNVILKKYGVDIDLLTKSEIKYMEREIAKRWKRIHM